MPKQINLKLYEGLGAPAGARGQTLGRYEPLFDPEDPADYIAGPGLRDAVNVAVALGQPLLVTGEPGTGKTRLAASVAHELELPPPLAFQTKTTSTATDLFYEYDALRRFQDAQTPDRRDQEIETYIAYQALGLAVLLSLPADQGDAFLPEDLRGRGPARSVVLIDEIDKAPRDLPNDVLNEIERMQFTVRETGRTFTADPGFRPILVLTSNSEKNLPDAFLRRCVFYHIPFPDEAQLAEILARRFRGRSGFTPERIKTLVACFTRIRRLDLKKPPATAEFLAWAGVLESLDVKSLEKPDAGEADILALSFSVLAKNREDLKRLCDDLKKPNRA